MKKPKVIWYVDLPNPQRSDEDDGWVNYQICFSRKEAVILLFNDFGIAEVYADLFIIRGEV